MRRDFSVSGRSSLTGFKADIAKTRLSIKFPFVKREILAKGNTKDYDNSASFSEWASQEYTSAKKGRWRTLASAAIIIFLCFLAADQTIDFKFLFSVLLGTLFWFRGIEEFKYIYKFPNILARWHGCEHKMLWLYKKGISRTYENIKNAKKESRHCGTVYTSSSLTFAISFFILSFAEYNFFTEYNFVGISIVFLVAHCTAILLSLFIQRLWSTAEPSHEQIMHALELAERLDAQLINKQASS